MINFTLLHPQMTVEALGFLPVFFSESDPRSAAEQADANYARGGGWNPLTAFRRNPTTQGLQYPGDPEMFPIACAKLRDERIFLYEHDWVCIVQPNDEFEVSRMD